MRDLEGAKRTLHSKFDTPLEILIYIYIYILTSHPFIKLLEMTIHSLPLSTSCEDATLGSVTIKVVQLRG